MWLKAMSVFAVWVYRNHSNQMSTKRSLALGAGWLSISPTFLEVSEEDTFDFVDSLSTLFSRAKRQKIYVPNLVTKKLRIQQLHLQLNVSNLQFGLHNFFFCRRWYFHSIEFAILNFCKFIQNLQTSVSEESSLIDSL